MSFTFYLFHHLFSLAWKPPLWEWSIKIFVYKFSHYCYGNPPSLVIFREITGKKANPVTRILLAWTVLAASHTLSSSTITSTQHAFEERTCALYNTDHFWYIKIGSKSIDLSTRLWNKSRKLYILSPESRADVYCCRLNLNKTKLVY